MPLIFDRKDQKAARLRAKVDVLKEQIDVINEALKHDEKILDLFERYHWDVALEKLMEPRVRYLAAASMELKPDERDNLISIRGQYEEAKKLARPKDVLVANIDENLKKLDVLGREMIEATAQLDKIKE